MADKQPRLWGLDEDELTLALGTLVDMHNGTELDDLSDEQRELIERITKAQHDELHREAVQNTEAVESGETVNLDLLAVELNRLGVSFHIVRMQDSSRWICAGRTEGEWPVQAGPFWRTADGMHALRESLMVGPRDAERANESFIPAGTTTSEDTARVIRDVVDREMTAYTITWTDEVRHVATYTIGEMAHMVGRTAADLYTNGLPTDEKELAKALGFRADTSGRLLKRTVESTQPRWYTHAPS